MIKLGIVGLRVGERFFDVIRQMEGVAIAGVCDTDETRLRDVAQSQNVEAACTAIDDMLQVDIDAVVLATPIQVHGRQAIAALEAGKHVLCQYVAAMDMREAERLVELSRTSNCKYMFIETDCYERKNMVMVALARQGALGELVMGRGHYIHNCRSMGRHEDGTLTWRGELWMESPAARHAAVHNAMPLLELFGERVVEVYSYGPGPRVEPQYAMHDRVTTVGKLPSGRVLELVSDNFSSHPMRTGYCLQGTLGCFEFDRASFGDGHEMSDWKNLDTLQCEFGLGPMIQDTDGHHSAWAACLRTFLHAIETNTSPPQDLFDALHITAIGWAANDSLRSGSPAQVVQFD